MDKKAQKQIEQSLFSATCKKWKQRVVYLYLLCMFSLFLFYFTNFYFNLTNSKYQFFMKATLITALLYGIITLLELGRNLAKPNKIASMKSYIKQFSCSEWFLLAWVISAILTTLLSSVPQLSLTGSNGRAMGLYFVLCISMAYFMVYRQYRLQQSLLLVFLGCSCLVNILALCNFFSIDPFQFFTKLSDYQGARYLSTIGNTNYLSSFLCLSLPFSMILYCYCTTRNSKFIYLLCSVIGWLTLLAGNSDAGYLGMGICLCIVAWMALHKSAVWINFVDLCVIVLLAGRIFSYLADCFPIASRGFYTISSFLTQSKITLLITIILAVYAIWLHTRKQDIEKELKLLRKVFVILVVGMGGTVIALVLYVNVAHGSLGFLNLYIRFDENWGTGRGMIWMHGMDAFIRFDLIEKIFGYGLDTTRLVMTSFFPDAQLQLYDNAHNEYLQYLLTGGLLNLCIYVGFTFTIIKRMMHLWHKEPFVFAISCCIIAYMVSALVNLNQPVTTPIFFLLLAIASSSYSQLYDRGKG